jgi:uncharacterized SAM-binding protein YcdF (DUF218 family)
MRRYRTVWFAGVAALAIGLALLAVAGRFVSAPAHEPFAADVIVALGGDGGSRVRKAAQLYAQGWAPRLLLTGIDGGDPAAREPFLEWRAALLVAQGVPRSAILFDVSSLNSRDEAAHAKALLQREGWRRAIVVSDPPHLRRLAWVWSRAFEGSGLDYRLVPSEMPDWNAAAWWRDEKSAQFVLMELIKLAYYAIRY